MREFLERIGIGIDKQSLRSEDLKKTAASLLALFLILILLPVGLFLIKNRQIFQPKAAGELIQLGEGGCIRINKAKQKVVDCTLVPLKLTNPFFKVVVASPSPSGRASVSPSPSPSPANSTDTSYNIDVLVIKYFPVTADNKIDITVTGDVGDSYDLIHQKTITITDNLLKFIPKATTYLGYKNTSANSAKPSINLKVVDTKEYKQAVPIKGRTNRPTYPDYNKIMTDNSICDYVDNKNVSYVFIWAYQGSNKPDTGQPFLGIDESKMSGPHGDISNSERLKDMPVCRKTYRVYTFNYGRGTAEAIESWSHQIEAEISEVNSDFFRNKWQGLNYPQTLNVNGRCGSAHNPPNARDEYDRANPTPQKSDCLDWNADGLGTLADISCTNWGCQEVSDSNNPSLNYMVWNWQDLPGMNNTKTYQGKKLRNIWDIHGKFDQIMGGDKSIFLPSSQTSPSPSASPSPSPSPSPSAAGTPQNVNARSFNNNIQAALNSIKQSGGSVYLPSGTYTIRDKIRLYSNTTLFGDGIGQTIIKFADGVTVRDMMANDSSSGQQNIVVRDLTLQGPDIPMRNGCCYGLKLENLDGGYVINVEVKDVGMDGIYLGYKLKEGVAKGVRNVRVSGCKVAFSQRHQIGVIVGGNIVIDNCTTDGTNKHGRSVYTGIDLEPDDDSNAVTNSYILNNNVLKSNIGIALNGKKGESGKDFTVNNNKVCGNEVNAKTIDISDSGKDNYVINNESSRIELNSTTKTSPASVCAMPQELATLPAAPNKPQAANPNIFGGLVKKVNAQTTATSIGKLKYRLAESQGSLEQAEWKEVAFLPPDETYASKNLLNAISESFSFVVLAQGSNDSDDDFLDTNTTSSPSPSLSPSPSSNMIFSIGPEFINTSFQLGSAQTGAKQIWVEFLHPDGASKIGNVNFNLVEKPPQILGLSCNLDIAKENLKINITGERFGTGVGTVETVTPAAKPEVLGWNNKEINAFLKKPNIPVNEGQRFKIKLTRTDGFESGIVTCTVDKSLISLGARIFCREPGKFDTSNVIVNIIYNPSDPANPNKLNKIEEKVTINADGEITNLKTKLQVGKNYAMAIKAPSSLRRTAVFTAQEGTTQIPGQDGMPFILPIGDIAPPISPDGRINTIDRAELIRQWRILGEGKSKPTGDFNRDSRVNSIDWACMRFDFGAEDEPIPVSIPQSASGTIKIPEDDTAIIPSASPSPGGSQSPFPSPSRDTSNAAKIDIGGKIFLDTNRNRIPDFGESYIGQADGTVKLLQVPEDHVVGTPLTSEELANSRILTQVTNNLPGANYDLSVFVDKDTSNKFSLVATANSGQLTGTVDFALGSPLTDLSTVINMPVTSTTQ